MRARLIFIVLAAIVVGALAVQNWPELSRSGPVTIGLFQTTMSLGVALLAILVVTLAVFLISSVALESRHLLDHRRHSREMQAQRELADKAEASRFTDLRQHLDTHLRESRQRDSIVATEFEKTVMQGQRELRAQIEQLNHMLARRFTEMEARIGARPMHVSDPGPVVTDVPARDRVL